MSFTTHFAFHDECSLIWRATSFRLWLQSVDMSWKNIIMHLQTQKLVPG